MQPSTNPNVHVRVPRPNVPDKSTIYVEALYKDLDGPIKHLRVAARVETIDMLLRADEIIYDEDSGDVEAIGHVHFEHFLRNERIDCDRAEYNMDDETGNFYVVSGSAASQIQARPGLLTTQTPFFFQAKWAERLKDHYILHDGFLTDCLIPNPWWRLKGPVFNVMPGDHAIARNSWFYIRNIPIFYAPWFYKSLKKEPRRSGFLIPNFGNSSAHGKMLGMGYYWLSAAVLISPIAAYITPRRAWPIISTFAASSPRKPTSISTSSES